jgi:His-Xaa-Ser system protein HxsD
MAATDRMEAMAPTAAMAPMEATVLTRAMGRMAAGSAVADVSSLRLDVAGDLVQVDAQARSVSLSLDATLYPLSAVYAASYVFLDRCFVVLDRIDAARVRVTASWKKPKDGDSLERLAGELANELLSCAWRAKIAEESRAIIESTTARALGGALGPPSLDDLETFSFDAAPFDDPLGIAMSWEDKYGKKKPAADEEPKDPGKKEPA